MPIPAQYRDAIQLAEFRYKVPGALIAAVCDDTGWDPDFILLNPDRSFRRVGLAGIWCRLPEFPFAGYHGTCWWGWYPDAVYCGPTCASAGQPSATDVLQGRAVPWDWARHIDAAARILRLCWDWSVAACGYPSTLIWYYWTMGGCSFTGLCELPVDLPDSYRQYITRMNVILSRYCDVTPTLVCPLPPPGEKPPTVSLSANALEVPPDTPLTFQANVSGGIAPYRFEWSFGDGSDVVATDNPTVKHSYAAEGQFAATVMVRDAIGRTGTSSPLTITVKIGVPPPPGDNLLLWGLLGLLGLAGAVGLATRKTKRQRAQELRQRAQALRAEAAKRRAAGDQTGAARLEQEAGRLEAEAQRLEQEAAREDVERAQRQMQQRRT